MITKKRIALEKLVAMVSAPGHGGLATFSGAVRNNHEGKRVKAVTYEAFGPLAEKILREIVRKAEKRHNAKVAAAHRLGKLFIGEVSVAIAAGSPHRAEAFAACRDVIEGIKKRLPVWKKEHYAGGDSKWLPGCSLHKP